MISLDDDDLSQLPETANARNDETLVGGQTEGGVEEEGAGGQQLGANATTTTSGPTATSFPAFLQTTGANRRFSSNFNTGGAGAGGQGTGAPFGPSHHSAATTPFGTRPNAPTGAPFSSIGRPGNASQPFFTSQIGNGGSGGHGHAVQRPPFGGANPGAFKLPGSNVANAASVKSPVVPAVAVATSGMNALQSGQQASPGLAAPQFLNQRVSGGSPRKHAQDAFASPKVLVPATQDSMPSPRPIEATQPLPKKQQPIMEPNSQSSIIPSSQKLPTPGPTPRSNNTNSTKPTPPPAALTRFQAPTTNNNNKQSKTPARPNIPAFNEDSFKFPGTPASRRQSSSSSSAPAQPQQVLNNNDQPLQQPQIAVQLDQESIKLLEAEGMQMDLDGLAGGSQTMMMQREQMIEEEEEMAVDSRRLGPVAAFAPATSSQQHIPASQTPSLIQAEAIFDQVMKDKQQAEKDWAAELKHEKERKSEVARASAWHAAIMQGLTETKSSVDASIKLIETKINDSKSLLAQAESLTLTLIELTDSITVSSETELATWINQLIEPVSEHGEGEAGTENGQTETEHEQSEERSESAGGGGGEAEEEMGEKKGGIIDLKASAGGEKEEEKKDVEMQDA